MAATLAQFALEMAELQVPLVQGRMMREARSASGGETVPPRPAHPSTEQPADTPPGIHVLFR